MATVLVNGPRTWSMSRDEEGHREYTITHLVMGSTLDGPATAINTPGLPLPGSLWLVDNDIDVWAWCRWSAKVTPLVTNEPNQFFEVEQTFSTKPPDNKKQRCNDTQIDDPLLEPNKISGGFSKYSEETAVDRFGSFIKNSCHEQIRGPQVEFDHNRPTIKVEQNVAILGIEVFARMIDTVNSAPIWGLPARSVKLSSVTWERKFYGSCYKYYTRTFEFDVSYNTFDRDVLDEGTKVLNGKWSPTTSVWEIRNLPGDVVPNPADPSHFIRFEDPKGNFIRGILNGFGLPAGVIIPVSTTGSGDRFGMFISIQNNNQDQLILDEAWWIPLYIETSALINSLSPTGPEVGDVIPQDTFPYWDGSSAYAQGYIVLYSSAGNTSTYVSLTDIEAEVFDAPDLTPATWKSIFIVSYEGNHSIIANYTEGDIVLGQSLTFAGSIHIEKYQESNFLILGIPLIL